TESALLAAGGALGALAFAVWGVKALVSLGPKDLPRLAEVHPDSTVLLFTALLAAGTCLVFGLVPALRATRPDLAERLKSRERALLRRPPRAPLRRAGRARRRRRRRHAALAFPVLEHGQGRGRARRARGRAVGADPRRHARLLLGARHPAEERAALPRDGPP